MKALAQTLAAALGYTFLAGIWLLGPVLDPAHAALYHWAGDASSLFLPLLADFLLLWLIVTVLMLSAAHPGRWRRTLWLFLLLFLPWLVLKKTIVLYSMASVPGWLTRLALGLAAALFCVLVLAWKPAWDASFARALRFASTCLAFAALPAVGVLLQLGVALHQARHLNPATAFDHPLPAVSSPPPARVVWVVFDELSDAQLFDRRFPGLKLPAFDALAAGSTHMASVVPAGFDTEIVFPALMTGHPVESIASTTGGRLQMHLRGTGGNVLFDQHDTVFTDAHKLGLRTAVAGWYNPYCRLLPDVLDHCFWTDHVLPWLGVTPGAGLGANMRAPIESAISTRRGSASVARLLGIPPIVQRDASQHIEDLHELEAASDALLRDPRYGFVLIHLPVPHPPGIFDRKSGQLSTDGTHSYIDNLALADATLAHLRQQLEATGQWDRTTLVLMGDHGWRWNHWDQMNAWQAEDVQARGDLPSDLRPAWFIKLPGQTQGTRNTAPFAAVNTRALFDALLAGSIRTPAELDTFLAAHTSRP